MLPKPADVVQSLRQHLEASSYGLGQVNDNELETWLFQPGSDRVHLLQWCLGQLDPNLRERFQNCDGDVAEKRTIEYAKNFGLSLKTDVILGSADQKEQIAMWVMILSVLQVNRHQKQSQPNGGKSKGAIRQTIMSLIRQRDLTDLLHTKTNLFPPDLRIVAPVIHKTTVEEELRAAILELEELQEEVNNSLSDNEDNSNADRSVHSSSDYREKFLESIKKIQECYRHIETTVFPAVRKQPENPIAEVLGNYFEEISDKVISFVQMMKETEQIHQMAKTLETTNVDNTISPDPSDLQQCISKCHSLVSETLSLWRLHNML